MSEYWKSTPKYWCKHCKIYVRDTKLEKQNHDATPKHQGNIKRFLRGLHRGNERDEREKQRARDEVARLNGGPSASGSSVATRPAAGLQQTTTKVTQSTSKVPQLTPAERKRQLAQLAELGVAVPEDYRREVAMAGDWQVLSQRLIQDESKSENTEEQPTMSDGNMGARKRKLEELDDDDEDSEKITRKPWGSAVRDYPGRRNGDDELDALLASTTMFRRVGQAGAGVMTGNHPTQGTTDSLRAKVEQEIPLMKKEESLDLPLSMLPTAGEDAGSTVVKEEDGESPGIGMMFKKRKPKPIRQK